MKHRCALGVLLFAGCASPEPYAPALTVWSEYLSPDEVSAQLEFIEQERLALNLAVERGSETDSRLLEILAAADRRRIPVRLWPLLPEEEGYWVNEHNLDAIEAHVEELVARLADARHSVVAVTFDLEPDIRRVQRMEQLAASADSSELIGFLREARDPEHLVAARKQLRTLVEWVKGQGFEAHASTLPMVLDAGERRAVTEDLLDTPLAGIPWDRLSFQVYRSWFDDHFGRFAGEGGRYTPHLVFSYATTAREMFGAPAAIDLGLIQPPGSGRFDAAEELVADLAAARAAKIPADRLQLYSLDGLAPRAERREWLAVPAEAQAPEPAQSTTDLRELFALLAAF